MSSIKHLFSGFVLLASSVMLFMTPSAAAAQEQVEASVMTDIVSRYVWRGLDRCGFSVQPAAEVRWQGLSFQAQGSTGIQKDDLQEINLTLAYQNSGFNIGVTDFWQTGLDPDNRYFYFDSKKTPHVLEGNLGFACKYFSLQAYTMFWGNDFKKNGERAYSTYIEASVPFRLGGVDLLVQAGCTPMESAGQYEDHQLETFLGTTTVSIPNYLYAEGFACNKASIRATKELFVGDVRVPIFAELHANPYLQTARLLFGVSIIPF